MPYLRVYSRAVPLVQKRDIARKLIDITLRAFQLRPEDRSQITVQFLPIRHAWSSYAVQGYEHLPEYPLTLEVRDHNLTEGKRRAFASEAAPVLTKSLGALRGPIARLLGRKPDPGRQVAFQFSDLDSPAEQKVDRSTEEIKTRLAA
jgi:hypothetical protein